MAKVGRTHQSVRTCGERASSACRTSSRTGRRHTAPLRRDVVSMTGAASSALGAAPHPIRACFPTLVLSLPMLSSM